MKLKQSLCKHRNLVTTEYVNDIHGYPYVVETHVKCAKCGKMKYFYAYGQELVKDWKRR